MPPGVGVGPEDEIKPAVEEVGTLNTELRRYRRRIEELAAAGCACRLSALPVATAGAWNLSGGREVPFAAGAFLAPRCVRWRRPPFPQPGGPRPCRICVCLTDATSCH